MFQAAYYRLGDIHYSLREAALAIKLSMQGDAVQPRELPIKA